MIGAGRRKVPRGFSARKSRFSGAPGVPHPGPSRNFSIFVACGPILTAGPHMGASLLSFDPTSMTKDHHWKDGKCFEGKEPIDFVTRTEATGVSRLSGGDFFEPKRRTNPNNKTLKKLLSFLERNSGITEVPFGRTELS